MPRLTRTGGHVLYRVSQCDEQMQSKKGCFLRKKDLKDLGD